MILICKILLFLLAAFDFISGLIMSSNTGDTKDFYKNMLSNMNEEELSEYIDKMSQTSTLQSFAILILILILLLFG